MKRGWHLAETTYQGQTLHDGMQAFRDDMKSKSAKSVIAEWDFKQIIQHPRIPCHWIIVYTWRGY